MRAFAIVSADKADGVLKFIKAQKHKSWLIGEGVKGKGEARAALLDCAAGSAAPRRFRAHD